MSDRVSDWRDRGRGLATGKAMTHEGNQAMALWLTLNGLLVVGAYLLGSMTPGYWTGQFAQRD